MNRVVHFEIHAENQDKIQKFYQEVFGWDIQTMGPEMGNYRMVSTGKDTPGEKWPGINGGITPRTGQPAGGSLRINAFVCTISVENIDSILSKIESAGGKIALEKMEVPGVGILAYCKDPEENIFGVLQPS